MTMTELFAAHLEREAVISRRILTVVPVDDAARRLKLTHGQRRAENAGAVAGRAAVSSTNG